MIKVSDGKYIEKMMQELIDIRNKKIGEKKYYKVIMDYSSYDSDYNYTTSIMIKIPQFPYSNCMNSFGIRRDNYIIRNINVYAIKDETGIYEMVTGLPLNTFETNNYVFCYGIQELSNDSLFEIGRDLKFLDNNQDSKDQYINNLLIMSNNKYYEYQYYLAEKNENQQQKNKCLQYLNNYKLPRN